MKSPVDHLLLNLGSKVYKVSPDADDLLHFLIKEIPVLPVVRDQKIEISVKTTGHSLTGMPAYILQLGLIWSPIKAIARSVP